MAMQKYPIQVALSDEQGRLMDGLILRLNLRAPSCGGNRRLSVRR